MDWEPGTAAAGSADACLSDVLLGLPPGQAPACVDSPRDGPFDGPRPFDGLSDGPVDGPRDDGVQTAGAPRFNEQPFTVLRSCAHAGGLGPMTGSPRVRIPVGDYESNLAAELEYELQAERARRVASEQLAAQSELALLETQRRLAEAERRAADAREQATDYRDKVAELEERTLCIVCLSAERSRLPACNHLCMCDGCAIKTRQCPVCRRRFRTSKTVYLP